MNACDLSVLPPPTARGIRGLDAVPPLAWLALQAAALWPHWHWAAARLADGSDDPLGLAALAVLGWVLGCMTPHLRPSPRPGWLAAALVGSVLATGAAGLLPPLLCAVLAALAMAAAVGAFMPAGHALLPVAGLAVLALPVVSSLQFYAGWPLRLVTAEASTWLLRLAGMAAERSGTALEVQGRLVIVDAPCSGVQMVWMAYFCACTVAALRGVPDGALVRRLLGVGGLVLCGNVLRNSVLVALEVRLQAVPEWVHQTVGLGVLALLCAAVVALVAGAARAEGNGRGNSGSGRGVGSGIGIGTRSGTGTGTGTGIALLAQHRSGALKLASAVVSCLCAAWPWAGNGASALGRAAPTHLMAAATPASSDMPLELLRSWDDKPLRPLALTAVEQRFAARFPGRIERLTDGEQVLVLREVRQPTRMLHPAADCYRGLGHHISEARLERDAQQRLWRCFTAERGGRRLRVCERIVDAHGQAFTDTSSWFWAAQLGRSTGPWSAVTTARPL